jgi:hypothetical protein
MMALLVPSIANAETGQNADRFREDRVYNYFTSDSFYNRYLVKMKFSGSTEIDGLKYQNLTNCYQGIVNTSSISPTKLDKDILVRKENGKVYARLPEDYLEENSLEFDAETGYSNEVMLYDFKCPVGDSFTSINEEGQPIIIKVISEEQVEIDGESLRKIGVRWSYDQNASSDQEDSSEEDVNYIYGEAEIIENIGFVSSPTGCFFAFVNTNLTSGARRKDINSPSQMKGAHRSDLLFWKITDTNGDELYAEFQANTPDPGYGLFRTDRTWSYEAVNNHPVGDSLYYLEMRFDGTEDLEGVTYHRFVNSRQHISVSDDQYHAFKPNDDTILVREEKGKVYVRYPYELGVVRGLEYKEDSKYSDEVMIYDFKCPVGDTFTTLGYEGPLKLKVTGEEYVRIGGERLRKITASEYSEVTGEPMSPEFEIVENIGVTSPMGFFTYLQNDMCAVRSKTLPITSNFVLYFCKYSDNVGTALYSSDRQVLPCFKTINDENVWEYFTYTSFASEGNVSKRNTQCKIERYKFDGTEKKGDYVYNRFCRIGVSAWRVGRLTYSDNDDFYTGAYAITNSDTNECVALLREDEGKIYMLLDRSQVECINTPYTYAWTRDVENKEEVLLYDFTATTGDDVQSFINNRAITELKVSRHDRRSVNGLGQMSPFDLTYTEEPQYTESDYPLYYINISTLEGVGNIGTGNFIDLACEYSVQPTCADITRTCLNNLYDKDGNVLYGGSNRSVPDPNGVDAIITDSDNAESAPMYDLMGRRITSPAKGQIYIQNGKKFIGQSAMRN